MIAQNGKLRRNLVFVRITWALLAALWNVVGVILISQGMRAPGPTASLLAAALLLAVAAILGRFWHRSALLDGLLAVLTGAMAGASVANAFTAEPALWPSEFWRYCGIALNSAGALSSFTALSILFRRRPD